jgi:hypothetical protein
MFLCGKYKIWDKKCELGNVQQKRIAGSFAITLQHFSIDHKNRGSTKALIRVPLSELTEKDHLLIASPRLGESVYNKEVIINVGVFDYSKVE